ETDAVDRVSLVRHDVPRHRHGGDPILAHLRLCPAGGGEEDGHEGREHECSRPSQRSRRHGVTTTIPPMSGPWIQQNYLDVACFVNVTCHDWGRGRAFPSAVTGVAKKPFPCVFPS